MIAGLLGGGPHCRPVVVPSSDVVRLGTGDGHGSSRTEKLGGLAAGWTLMRPSGDTDDWVAPAPIRRFRRPLRRRLDEHFERAMLHRTGSRTALRTVVRDAVREGVAAGASPATIEAALRTYFSEHPARLAFDRPSVMTGESFFDRLEADIRRWIEDVTSAERDRTVS